MGAFHKEEWPAELRPLLRDDTHLGFLSLPIDDAADYDLVKPTILQRMGITANSHQKCWWAVSLRPKETGTQWT